MDKQSENLGELFDRIESAISERDEVSIDDILEKLGPRSFGPLLLLAGLVIVAPFVGDIPGVPTLMGIVVALIAVQMLLRRDYFWFPKWLRRRSVSKEKLRKMLDWLRRPARFVDRWISPRLEFFFTHGGVYAVAVACLITALITPLLEFVPFSANGAGIALALFGLSIIARDGLLAAVALLLTAGTFGLVLYNLIT